MIVFLSWYRRSFSQIISWILHYRELSFLDSIFSLIFPMDLMKSDIISSLVNHISGRPFWYRYPFLIRFSRSSSEADWRIMFSNREIKGSFYFEVFCSWMSLTVKTKTRWSKCDDFIRSRHTLLTLNVKIYVYGGHTLYSFVLRSSDDLWYKSFYNILSV